MNFFTKKTICQLHKEIIDYATDIETIDINKMTYVELQVSSEKIIAIANKIRILTEEAMKAGQSMEDRLALYKESIEHLGFKRVKNIEY